MVTIGTGVNVAVRLMVGPAKLPRGCAVHVLVDCSELIAARPIRGSIAINPMSSNSIITIPITNPVPRSLNLVRTALIGFPVYLIPRPSRYCLIKALVFRSSSVRAPKANIVT